MKSWIEGEPDSGIEVMEVSAAAPAPESGGDVVKGGVSHHSAPTTCCPIGWPRTARAQLFFERTCEIS